jgi:hypothetical protein
MGRGGNQIVIPEVVRFGLDFSYDGPAIFLAEIIDKAFEALDQGKIKEAAEIMFGEEKIKKDLISKASDPHVQRLLEKVIETEVLTDNGYREIENFYANLYLTIGVEGGSCLFVGREQPGSPIHILPDLNSDQAACGQQMGDRSKDYFRGIKKTELAAAHPMLRCRECAAKVTRVVMHPTIPDYPVTERVEGYEYLSSALGTFLSSDMKKVLAKEEKVLSDMAVDIATQISTRPDQSPEKLLRGLMASSRHSITNKIAALAEEVWKEKNDKLALIAHFGIHPDSPERSFFKQIENTLNEPYKNSGKGWPSGKTLHSLIANATHEGLVKDHEHARAAFLAEAICESVPLFATNWCKNYDANKKFAQGNTVCRVIMNQVFVDRGFAPSTP